MSVEITRFEPGDRLRWTELWRAYLDFYQTVLPDAVYDHTWSRILAGTELRGLAARSGGGIVGITHFMFHPHGWTLAKTCYLQDLFVDPAVRGAGVGRALIEAVAEVARAGGADRMYWLTNASNTDARGLYDKIAVNKGFIKYDYSL